MQARCVADLPQWLLDLGDQLGVQRPVDLRRWDDSDAAAATPPKLPPIVIDGDDENADWLRHTWPETWPHDRAGLLALLADLRTTVDEFKTWPI